MSSRHSLIARTALNNSSRELNEAYSYRFGRKHSHPSGARLFPAAQENQTIVPCWRTPPCSLAVRKGPQPPWHNLALFGNTGLPLGSSLTAASVMRDISVSAGPLIGLASPAPSMEGERLKLSMIGFANRCQSNHRGSQRAPFKLGFYVSVLANSCHAFSLQPNQAAVSAFKCMGISLRGMASPPLRSGSSPPLCDETICGKCLSALSIVGSPTKNWSNLLSRRSLSSEPLGSPHSPKPRHGINPLGEEGPLNPYYAI